MEDDWKIFAARVEAILPTLATKADMEALRADVARWTVATVIGLFIGFGGLFLAMSNALKPGPGPAQQAQPPIVIYTPTAPAAQPQPGQKPQAQAQK